MCFMPWKEKNMLKLPESREDMFSFPYLLKYKRIKKKSGENHTHAEYTFNCKAWQLFSIVIEEASLMSYLIYLQIDVLILSTTLWSTWRLILPLLHLEFIFRFVGNCITLRGYKYLFIMTLRY